MTVRIEGQTRISVQSEDLTACIRKFESDPRFSKLTPHVALTPKLALTVVDATMQRQPSLL